MTSPEHAGRLAPFQEMLVGRGLDGALLVQATDVFYFAGTRQSSALWIPAGGAPVLLVRRSYERARKESALADVRPFPPSRALAAAVGKPRRVGFTFDVAPVTVQQFWLRVLGAELVDVAPELRQQRSVKSAWEVDRIRDSAALMCRAYREVPRFLHAGMTELELAAELEYHLRKGGNEGAPRLRGFNLELNGGGLAVAGVSSAAPGAFDGPVTGCGLSAAAPVGASTARIPRHAPVMLDYTAMKEGYIADMTRMAVCGELGPELEHAFGVALSIQDLVAESLRPGAVPSAIWEQARARAERAGLGELFMGPPGAQARFVGHGVGLELDELPVLAPGFDLALVAGQTIAVEPKFVLPGVGAIGIENTWVVTDGGGVRLTDLDDAIMVVA